MPTILSLFLLAAGKNIKDIKKEYCKDYASGKNKANDYFVGNPPKKYPHLHCGKDFLTLSKGKGAHNELKGNCGKIHDVYYDKKHFYETAGEPDNITAVLKKYFGDICPGLEPLNDVNEELPKPGAENTVPKSGR